MALTLGWQMEERRIRLQKAALSMDSQAEELYHQFENILAAKAIRSVFQPIVSLADGEIMGYEALSRGPQGSLLERPDLLFSIAEQYNKIWELDVLCRINALEKAQELPTDKMLFINVDPKVINDERFRKGATREVLKDYKISACNIIFEITEKSSVSDYKSFRQVLDHYTSQGYKIAIDDTGSGYSGLRMLAETRPQYIKIDMELVRDIDKDSLKQALMKAFYGFAKATNIKIIAEGIETGEELKTLIDIGVQYGQGYFLQKPAAEFLEISPVVREFICQRNEKKRQEAFHTPLTMPIGEISRQDCAFPPEATGAEIAECFIAQPHLMGVPIIKNGMVMGLMMKDKFFSQLATQFGVAVYMNRQIQLVMDKNPLIVDYQASLEQVTELALSRREDTLYDYIIVTKNGRYYGITTIKGLLGKTTQLEIQRAKHCNPLSGLPGNILIEEKLKEVLELNQVFGVLYFDIDNFKAYNDVYGFDNGDKIIALTAKIIQTEVEKMNLKNIFIGHIGGDDFIAILMEGDIKKLCEEIISNFDHRVRGFYNEEDQRRGHIISKNRHGIEENFPIISLSIAVVSNRMRRFLSPTEVAEAASAVKKKCKMEWRSCYHIE